LSMVVLLIYTLIVEPIIRLVINKYVLAKAGLFFPAKVITKLTPIPENGLVEFVRANAEVNGIGGSLSLPLNITLAVVYTVIFYMISRQILLKRDL